MRTACPATRTSLRHHPDLPAQSRLGLTAGTEASRSSPQCRYGYAIAGHGGDVGVLVLGLDDENVSRGIVLPMTVDWVEEAVTAIDVQRKSLTHRGDKLGHADTLRHLMLHTGLGNSDWKKNRLAISLGKANKKRI